MMTTVSAIVGTLPIAIGVGASAASRRPLGIAVVGGLAFSQIVTLYVTPVFYSYFDELQSWLGRPCASGDAESPAGAASGGGGLTPQLTPNSRGVATRGAAPTRQTDGAGTMSLLGTTGSGVVRAPRKPAA